MTSSGNCFHCGTITCWFDSKKKIWDCGEHHGTKQNLEMTTDKDPTIGINRAERRLYKRKGIVLK